MAQSEDDAPLADVPVAELIRRCEEENDDDACAELDRRGIEPPMLDLDEPPIPRDWSKASAEELRNATVAERREWSQEEFRVDRWNSETEGGLEYATDEQVQSVS
jgi:hypothetical protein